MSSARRSLFKRVAGLVAIGTVAPRATARLPTVSVWQPIVEGIGKMPVEGPRAHAEKGQNYDPDKIKLWASLMRVRRGQHAMRADQARMLGLPPHLASMHSCAPWWRARKALEWSQNERDLLDVLEEEVRARIFAK
jgi:hypothetical protein